MEKQITVSELPVHYTDAGTGDVVVLIHGLAEDGSVWEQQTLPLSAGYRVLIPDLPGSGLSALPGNLSMESLAAAVKAVLENEGISEAVIIGHSMGGYTTLAFAELYPDMVKAFGLFHSTAVADSEEKIASRKKNIDFILSNGTLTFLKTATPSSFSPAFQEEHPDVIEELIARYSSFDPLSLVAYNEAMVQRPDRKHVLAGAACPVLFVIGKQDDVIPFEQSLQMAHLPDTAYIHVLEKSGHMGMMEEPENSTRILNKFLDDIYMA